MSLSYESLEAFVTAAETGSFTSAARKLSKAQSTISTLIGNLEIDWDIQLFDRSGKYPKLTEEGGAMLGDARLAMARLKSLNSRACSMAELACTKLTLISDELMSIPEMAELSRLFSQRFPDVELSLLLDDPAVVLNALENRQADIAVGGFSGIPVSPWIDIRQPGTQELVTIVSPEHPLVALDYVTEENLAKYRQITHLPSTSSHCGVTRWHANSYFTMMHLAVKGVGWAKVPRSVLNELVTPNAYVILDGDSSVKPQYYPFQIAVRKDVHLGEAGHWLIEAIEKLAQ